ncbi:M20/M25/M40 family metallo-hydrolase [Terracidiphilus sp.]|uniref:M20/M25/M40 family metallo-hydrolase n=1 Tax=Terracidiphilus sp. TaxID=1964191 RepID=UPI003C26BA50
MKLSLLLLAGMLASAPCVTAQRPDYTIDAAPVSAPVADPAIARAIATIDAARIHGTIETLVGFGTRNTASVNDTTLPAGKGAQAAADWIFDEFTRISTACGNCLEIKRDIFIQEPDSGPRSRIVKPTQLTNIYAILRGTDPILEKHIVLVTGHYDSINSNAFKNWADTSGDAPGANDDASGVAVSLECARALSKLRFPATIIFVAVPGEEQGLFGSAHLAKLMKDEGWQGENGKLDAVLNNDIVGGNTTPGDTLQLKDRVRVFSEGVPVAATPEQARRIRAIGGESDSPSRELARAIVDAARAYLPASGEDTFAPFLVARPDRYLRGGDHSSFNQQGFAAVRFTEWREDYNHQHQSVLLNETPIKGDLLQFVDTNYVARVARLNAATLATLASSPGAPAKVTLDTQKLENGTTLKIDPAPGTVDHYELLWRETTSFYWQFAQRVPVTAATEPGPITFTVPISKDNVIFGVRAVDAAGHRSLVVVP